MKKESNAINQNKKPFHISLKFKLLQNGFQPKKISTKKVVIRLRLFE